MYTRKQLEIAFINKLPNAKTMMDLHFNMTTMLDMVIREIFIRKMPEDADTAAIREASLDLSTKGSFNYQEEK